MSKLSDTWADVLLSGQEADYTAMDAAITDAEADIERLIRERDEAREEIISGWNAFGSVAIHTIQQADELAYVADGTIAEQIAELVKQHNEALARIRQQDETIKRMDEALWGGSVMEIARAIVAERSRKVTAFLDAILEDPEAMERIDDAMIDGDYPYVVHFIEALKQEAER